MESPCTRRSTPSAGVRGKTILRGELTSDEEHTIRVKLEGFRLEHRALDAAIERLAHDPLMDQLQLRRLKKRKLALKDIIARLESQLIPDQPA